MQEILQRSQRNTGPRRAINRPSALTQAYDMRDFAAKCALDLQSVPCETLADKVARARALRDYNSVWDTTCDRARVLRNRPLPGSLKPEAKSKPKRKAVIEPLPEAEQR